MSISQQLQTTKTPYFLPRPPLVNTVRPQVAFLCNSIQGLLLFRQEVIYGLHDAGYQVSIIAPYEHGAECFISNGINFVDLSLSGQGRNPAGEGLAMIEIYQKLRLLRPEVVFSYTIKPNIYGAWACRRLGIKCIAVVPGLGILPSNKSQILKRTLAAGYRYAAESAEEVWFLNQSDQKYFSDRGWGTKTKSCVLPGEGVNLKQFPFKALPGNSRFQVLFIGRLLISKGVRVFAEAARLAFEQGLPIDFKIVGFLSEDHHEGLQVDELNVWVDSGYVDFAGSTNNPAAEIAKVDMVAVPTTYREGLNRVIQESLAMGRTVVTTAVPGAGELVQHQKTGYIVPPNNPAALLAAIEYHSSLPTAKKVEIAKAGSNYIRRHHDVGQVLAYYWNAIRTHTSVGR